MCTVDETVCGEAVALIISKLGDHTSEKKKYPRMSPHTTVRYDMAVAGDASTNRNAAVRVTCAPYAHDPAEARA